jgi:hypothetical protein
MGSAISRFIGRHYWVRSKAEVTNKFLKVYCNFIFASIIHTDHRQIGWGIYVGGLIGEGVGFIVGFRVGFIVGFFVGDFVGFFVGAVVGFIRCSFIVGFFVGDFAGAFVEAVVAFMQWNNRRGGEGQN